MLEGRFEVADDVVHLMEFWPSDIPRSPLRVFAVGPFETDGSRKSELGVRGGSSLESGRLGLGLGKDIA
jgi:hypothetical protein